MEKLIRVLEGITATLWAITILYSIFFFLLGGFLLNDIFQEILIGLITFYLDFVFCILTQNS